MFEVNVKFVTQQQGREGVEQENSRLFVLILKTADNPHCSIFSRAVWKLE